MKSDIYTNEAQVLKRFEAYIHDNSCLGKNESNILNYELREIESIIIFINGVYGSGKTTFLKEYLSEKYNKEIQKFNRTENYGKNKLIHISPWSIDATADFGFFFTNELIKARTKFRIKYIGILLLLIMVGYYILQNLDKVFKAFIDSFNLSYLTIINITSKMGDVEGHGRVIVFNVDDLLVKLIFVSIFSALIFFLTRKTISLLYIINLAYYYIQGVLRSNSTKYMYEIQWLIIKKELEILYKRYEEVTLVIEDMDRLSEHNFNEVCTVINSLNDIALNILKESDGSHKLNVLITADEKRIESKYMTSDFEKLYQFKLDLIPDNKLILKYININLFKSINHFDKLERYQQVQVIKLIGLEYHLYEEITKLILIDNKQISYRNLNRILSQVNLFGNVKDKIKYVHKELTQNDKYKKEKITELQILWNKYNQNLTSIVGFTVSFPYIKEEELYMEISTSGTNMLTSNVELLCNLNIQDTKSSYDKRILARIITFLSQDDVAKLLDNQQLNGMNFSIKINTECLFKAHYIEEQIENFSKYLNRPSYVRMITKKNMRIHFKEYQDELDFFNLEIANFNIRGYTDLSEISNYEINLSEEERFQLLYEKDSDGYVFTISADKVVELYLKNKYEIFNLNIREGNASVGKNLNINFRKILKDSIENMPELFYVKNNGITIITENAHLNPEDIFLTGKLNLCSGNIVNGAQTISNLASLYSEYKANNEIEKVAQFKKVKLMLRVCEPQSQNIGRDITGGLNTQNPISLLDLLLLSMMGQGLLFYLAESGIKIAKKGGDSSNKMQIQDFIQLYFAMMLFNPGLARNSSTNVVASKALSGVSSAENISGIELCQNEIFLFLKDEDEEDYDLNSFEKNITEKQNENNKALYNYFSSLINQGVNKNSFKYINEKYNNENIHISSKLESFSKYGYYSSVSIYSLYCLSLLDGNLEFNIEKVQSMQKNSIKSCYVVKNEVMTYSDFLEEKLIPKINTSKIELNGSNEYKKSTSIFPKTIELNKNPINKNSLIYQILS